MAKTAADTSRMITALSAGIFVGAAVIDALPKAAATLGIPLALGAAAAGALLWWMQKLALGRLEKPDMSPLVASALWMHSVVEGLVTGLAFGISKEVGAAVLIGMVLHLLPEFFAAAGLMEGAGAKRRTSVAVTFAGYAILFGTFGLTVWLLPRLGGFPTALAAMTAGAFLYIGIRSWRKRGGPRTTSLFLTGILAYWVFSQLM